MIERDKRLEQETIARIFHIGDHTSHPARQGISWIVGRLIVFTPIAPFLIEHKPLDLLLLTSGRSQIDAPERSCLPIGQLCQLLLTTLDTSNERGQFSILAR